MQVSAAQCFLLTANNNYKYSLPVCTATNRSTRRIKRTAHSSAGCMLWCTTTPASAGAALLARAKTCMHNLNAYIACNPSLSQVAHTCTAPRAPTPRQTNNAQIPDKYICSKVPHQWQSRLEHTLTCAMVNMSLTMPAALYRVSYIIVVHTAADSSDCSLGLNSAAATAGQAQLHCTRA